MHTWRRQNVEKSNSFSPVLVLYNIQIEILEYLKIDTKNKKGGGGAVFGICTAVPAWTLF